MLMHSCCSILFNMLSGFDLNSKRIQNSFENKFGNLIWKKKRKFFSPSPFLILAAGPTSPPAGPVGRWPSLPPRQPSPTEPSKRAGPATVAAPAHHHASNRRRFLLPSLPLTTRPCPSEPPQPPAPHARQPQPPRDVGTSPRSSVSFKREPRPPRAPLLPPRLIFAFAKRTGAKTAARRSAVNRRPPSTWSAVHEPPSTSIFLAVSFAVLPSFSPCP